MCVIGTTEKEALMRRLAKAVLAVGMAVVAGLGMQNVAGADTRIIGGEPADQAYSFMASMQTRGGSEHNCGATLVAPEWLVTAAHCVEGARPAGWQFRIGSTTYNDGGEVVHPERFFRNPGYFKDIAGSDIALVKLAEPATSEPIAIGASTPADGSSIRLLGWGLRCPVRGCGEGPIDLQQVDTTVLPDSVCSDAAAEHGQTYDPSRELCENTENGTSSCYGDSGGPALALEGEQYVLVGDTSRGFVASCLGGPGVYNDVTAHRDWIAHVTKGTVT